jgi:hypothetical protein
MNSLTFKSEHLNRMMSKVTCGDIKDATGPGEVRSDSSHATFAFESSVDDESDQAPLPPEIIAASFEDEAEKLEFIDDGITGAGYPEERVDLPLEGHVDEEERPREEEVEDDAAPRPLEMIATAFEKRVDEEEKREEGEKSPRNDSRQKSRSCGNAKSYR